MRYFLIIVVVLLIVAAPLAVFYYFKPPELSFADTDEVQGYERVTNVHKTWREIGIKFQGMKWNVTFSTPSDDCLLAPFVSYRIKDVWLQSYDENWESPKSVWYLYKGKMKWVSKL